MLIIRLQRTGKKKQAYFRIVVQEHSQKTGGKFLESLGNLDPHANIFKINAERLNYWLKNGAQVSDSVWNRLVDQKLVEGPKRQIVRVKKTELKTEGIQASGGVDQKNETETSKSTPPQVEIENNAVLGQ